MKTNEDSRRIPVKYEILMAIVIPLIVLPVFCVMLFAVPFLGIDLRRMSFFRAFMTFVAIMLPVMIVPGAIFGEFKK